MLDVLRVGVIGAGPAGFYAAGHLLSSSEPRVEVDLLERLPTPWGLVRGGVAPDHPKIKSVSRVYEKTAAMPGFRFFGNLRIGEDVSHRELLEWYDAVVYSVGAAGDRRSGIEGEDLPGSFSATEFVGWYNGHPDHRDLPVRLDGHRAVVIGNGNVAVDVARMLCLGEAELRATDVAGHALETLVGSTIEEIVVLGRRGPGQAAFTTPELRELGQLGEADIVVDPVDLAIGEPARDEALDPTARRNVELLHDYAARPSGTNRRRIVLRFLSSPVEVLGAGRVEGVRVIRNELVRDADGRLSARATGREELIEASLVLRAIGYAGHPVPGLPFDERAGTIPHRDGRVVSGARAVSRTYVTGWIKRGPSGVIGTNKKCAAETVSTLLGDVAGGDVPVGSGAGPEEIERELRARQPDLVTYRDWRAIDGVERDAGQRSGRPRVKLTRVDELLDAAGVENRVKAS